MKTLILATRNGAELLPLTRGRCAALLPIAGKPLIVHAIESLAMASVTDVTIVAQSMHLQELMQELGTGSRWGVRIDYTSCVSTDSPDRVASRPWARDNEHLLVLRGDILRTPIIAEFMDRALMAQGPTQSASIGGICAGVRFVRHGASTPLGMPDEPADPQRWRDDAPAFDFPNARLSLIESLAAFHRANIEAISAGFPGLIVSGRNFMPRVTVGRKTRLRAQVLKGRPVFVGARCHIAASAELMEDVVVSDDVVIDRGVTLKSAVIMPHTYIGELLEVTDAIVQGDTLIHVDTGVVTTVSDPSLLRSMLSKPSDRRTRPRSDRADNPELAMLPKSSWFRAIVVTLARNPLRVLNRARSSNNAVSREHTTEVNSLGYRMLRNLVRLFEVVRGSGQAGEPAFEAVEFELNSEDSENKFIARRKATKKQAIVEASDRDEPGSGEVVISRNGNVTAKWERLAAKTE